ncbi:MAG: gamma carbonic anhydrase family protein [Sphingomonadaceae bacterium]|nr:gamma carbonic anhydrase family protein [Sphingomonadaceae bacterium]
MPLYELDGKRPTLPEDGSCWVAPSAVVVGDVRLARNTSIWFGVVIRADNTPITIGEGSNVQENAVLHSDPGKPLVIGRDCTIGHQAMLHGCTIGDSVLIGIGATVLNEAVIADESLVGAGALVTEGKRFPAGSQIIGSPARVMKELGEEQRAGLRKSAAGYVANARRFADSLRCIG